MTRDEAVRTLQSMKSDFPLPKAAQTRRAQNDALDVAIEALKAELHDDAISRRAAIDAFKGICKRCGKNEKDNGVLCGSCYLDDGISIVEELPPVMATKATLNVPGTPPVYAVSADDVIENMESELELCNKVLDDVNIVGTAHMIYGRVAEMLLEQIDFVKGLPQVEPKPRTGTWRQLSDGDYECSECGWESDAKYDYCQNCGSLNMEVFAK